MTFLLIAGYLALFCFIIVKWKWFRDPGIVPYLFVFLFLLKAAAGIFAGELYLKKYDGGDSFSFFKESKVITASAHENAIDFILMTTGFADEKEFFSAYGTVRSWDNQDVVYNDNKTIIRINAVIGLFSMGIYNVHVVFFAFISMMGLMAIYKGIRTLTDKNPYLILAAVFLVPGVVFWLSMASKESILVFAMGMMFYHCVRLLTVSNSFGNIAGMFLAGFLFIHIKAYLLVLITPCLLAFTWVAVTDNRMAVLKYTVVYLIMGIIFFNIHYLLDGFDPVNIIFMKRMNFEAFVDAFPGGMNSYIELPVIDSSWQSMLLSGPIAAFAVLTRPYIWESESLLITFAAIENILLIVIIVSGLIYFNAAAYKKNVNLIMFSVCFVISVYILIGLTSPVMGAMVRYKVPVLPFLCIIPILLSGPPVKKNKINPPVLERVK